MLFTATIDKNGVLTTEVTDRQGNNCENIKRITNSVGMEVSDENIGPECDKVTVTGSDAD